MKIYIIGLCREAAPRFFGLVAAKRSKTVLARTSETPFCLLCSEKSLSVAIGRSCRIFCTPRIGGGARTTSAGEGLMSLIELFCVLNQHGF
jgi:hypothetical protein